MARVAKVSFVVFVSATTLLYCVWNTRIRYNLRNKSWNYNENAINRIKEIILNKNASQVGANDQESKTLEKDEDILELDDVFISVKTSKQFHRIRTSIILNTWWNQAKKQTYFFTDGEDELFNNFTDGHFINTHCGNTHARDSLNCKMQSEYTFSLKMDKKWWCHFDDDNYVNIDQLLKLLRNFSSDEDFYIGKLSLNRQLRVKYHNKMVSFWFGTGGAGICISSALLTKMKSWASNGRFVETGQVLGQPDDVTMGFIQNNRLGIELTKIESLHSHLEPLNAIATEALTSQVTLSYRSENTINLDKAIFTIQQDPSRIYSLHCQIYPDLEWCLNKTIPKL